MDFTSIFGMDAPSVVEVEVHEVERDRDPYRRQTRQHNQTIRNLGPPWPRPVEQRQIEIGERDDGADDPDYAQNFERKEYPVAGCIEEGEVLRAVEQRG